MKRAIVNCRFYDVKNGESREHTTILWEDGVIKEVSEHLELPSDVQVIDGTGLSATPGLIDSFTHVGLKETGVRWEGDDTNEISSPIQSQLSVLDGIYPFDGAFQEASKGGITTVHVAPGPQNVFSGVSAILKTTGSIADDMALEPHHGLFISLGQVPKSTYSGKKKLPVTRMGIASLIRQELRKALSKERLDNEKYIDSALQREGKVYFTVHRADDIVTAIRLKKEFNLDAVLVHATEAGRIISTIAEAEVPVIAGPHLVSKMRFETQNLHPYTLVELYQSGIDFSLGSPIVRNLPIEGSLAIRAGVPYEEVLHSLTLGAANILGIEDRVGSIESGKHADLVLWDGEPLELTSRVQYTIIGGEIVYRREEE